MHGIIDYAFSAFLLAAPAALHLSKNAVQAYAAAGTAFLVMNAATDTPVAVKPVLSFKDHQKADAVFLSALGLLAFAGFVHSHRKTRLFHMGFLATAITHYLLTDYGAAETKKV